ncbi:hypothetical protein VNI00_018708 [Paramarasmius palmivorus]|uniref:CxC1-like cysteine cluster associated with KDZ transposases domain-containing protein n=1 Tax=Paramarasmius palmivorus TaxID=297713 RepID=A0AAW0AWD6_9AGAR
MSLRKSTSRLNNKVIIRSGGRFGLATREIQDVNKTREEKLKARRAQDQMLATMSFAQQDEHEHPNDLPALAPQSPFSSSGPEQNTGFMSMDVPTQGADSDDDSMDIDQPRGPNFPPGEEGAINSHVGGEYFFNQMLDDMIEHHPKRHDDRTRKKRVQKTVDTWRSQRPRLVKAYLAYKARGPPTNISGETEWSLSVLDFSTNGEHTFFNCEKATETENQTLTVNETLVRHGFIGASAERPVLAFSFSLFEIYRQVHRVCPRFSIDGLSKSLQYLHGMAREAHLENQLRTAYDEYLAILREVDSLSLSALGRLSEQAQTIRLCPPCTYKVKDETPLVPSILLSMDGNNSLKQVDPQYRAGQTREDDRELPDYRWLEEDTVDQFKDEVRKGQSTAKSSQPPNHPVPNLSTSEESPPTLQNDNDDDRIAWLNVNETEELAACVDTCVDRWKNAGPEARKKMFALFKMTGIFVAFISMKYPLAVIHALITKLGEKLGVGYDIMCAFFTTMKRSDKLRDLIKDKHLIGVVPAFHGHAHNRKCQVSWHPQYIEGVGIEDFEECERTFARSNNLASITRLSTPFHRRQEILEHFSFHSEDKFANAGKFILANYRQALKCINDDAQALEALFAKLHITAQDCEQFLKDEREHFNKPIVDVEDEESWKIDYVEVLQTWWAAVRKSNDAAKKHDDLEAFPNKYPAKQASTIRAQHRTTLASERLAEQNLLDLEYHHGNACRIGSRTVRVSGTLSGIE